MVYVGTSLRVIDNSGARVVECIKVLGNGKSLASAGAILVVAVKRVNPRKRLKKGEIYKAVLVGTSKSRLRKNGFGVCFDSNYVVIVNNKNIPIGTRVLGPVMTNVRSSGFIKIVSMATLSI
jgi:large subunit ribosomal protein L14